MAERIILNNSESTLLITRCWRSCRSIPVRRCRTGVRIFHRIRCEGGELEEFSILGDVVVRIANELEPEALDRVRIMSLEYAMKVLSDETDAKEFVRCVKAIASPDAGQFEYRADRLLLLRRDQTTRRWRSPHTRWDFSACS